MRVIWAGMAGAAAGGLLEALINRLAGRAVVSQGMMWGAVAVIVVASLPSFTRMGQLTVKSNKAVVNFVVGIIVFILISIVLILAFFALFLLLERLLR